MKEFNGTSCAGARFLCTTQEAKMGLGKGALLWMIGIPLPIILLLALFWR
jgi:hypothetical protein